VQIEEGGRGEENAEGNKKMTERVMDKRDDKKTVAI
jgi:hypothetical protein